MWHKKGTYLFVFLLIIAASSFAWNTTNWFFVKTSNDTKYPLTICRTCRPVHFLRHCATIHIWQTHPSVTHCKHYRFHHGWSSSRKSRMVCNGSTDLECKFSPSTRRFLSQSWWKLFLEWEGKGFRATLYPINLYDFLINFVFSRKWKKVCTGIAWDKWDNFGL